LKRTLQVLFLIIGLFHGKDCLANITAKEPHFVYRNTFSKDTNNKGNDSLNTILKKQVRYKNKNIKKKYRLKGSLHDLNKPTMGFDSADLVPKFLISSGNLEASSNFYKFYQKRKLEDRQINHQEMSDFLKDLIILAENSGFPFAKVNLDKITLNQHVVFSEIKLDEGVNITFDSLKITGDSKTKIKFLNKIIGIEYGEAFSQQKIERGIERLKSLSYLNWAGEAELSFQNEEATLHLPINDRVVNQVDGIVGLLPSNSGNNKYILTGSVDLALANIGGMGRNFSLNWQRPSISSQNLKLEIFEPHLLGGRLDANVDFFLFKQDSSFLNRSFSFKVGYPFQKFYFSFFSGNRSSNSIGQEMMSLENKINYIDNRFQFLGLKSQYQNIDQIISPRRGLIYEIEVGLGNKKIFPSDYLVGFNEYDLLPKNTFQYFFEGEFKHLYPFKRGLVFNSELHFGIIEGRRLYKNELYRLGGLKSLRGFNENFFFANNYIYFNFEPRFYFDTDSYFMIFANTGRLENKINNVNPVDFIASTGLGLSLQTEGGTFSFVIAQGNSNQQKFSLQQSRVHFGFTGKF